MLDAEKLRHDAIDALGAHGDPRALEIAQRARVVVVPAVKQWVGSGGTVHAHEVQLFVDASALGAMRAHPAVHDALVAAFASAIAREGNHSLHELKAYWGFESAGLERGYRAAPAHEIDRADGEAVKRGLAAYLEARGEVEAAARVRRAVVEVEVDAAHRAHAKASVMVRMRAEEDAGWFEREHHAAAALEEAGVALMAVPGGGKVRVRRGRE